MKFNLSNIKFGLSLFIVISVFLGCDNKLAPMNQYQVTPPDLSKRSIFESFSPDSGGIGTQLIIRGKNFGSVPEYVTAPVKKGDKIGDG